MSKKTKAPIQPKVEHGQDNLKCILTERELVEYGRRQATALSDMNKAADELKAFQTGIKNRMAELEAIINSLSEKLRSGYEFRFVAITIITDYEAGLVKFVLDDTGEVYNQRPLNTEERQFILDFHADREQSSQD